MPKYSEIKAMARPRVVFVLASLTAGGAERVLITLMNGLDRSRFEPVFLVLDDEGPLRDWVSPGIEFHTLKTKSISLSLNKLTQKLNALQPDIIFSTMAAMNFGVLLVKPLLKNNPKIIVREAVIPSSIIENQKLSWAVKSAYRNLYPRADLVLSPARCIIDEFRNYLGMDIGAHQLLPNPVDIDKIHARRPPGKPPASAHRIRTIKFVCSGRLHPQKGFDRLIEAMADFNPPLNWHLTILGAGKERTHLQNLVQEHRLLPHISMPGLVKNPWHEYAAADAFLLPSRWEGLPNVVLEALAVGTPVIGMAEAGGIRDIEKIAPAGSVTVADSIQGMLEKMKTIRPDPYTYYEPSLLPDEYRISNVIERLSSLLDGAAPFPLRQRGLPSETGRNTQRSKNAGARASRA